jgi:hypothetical protein
MTKRKWVGLAILETHIRPRVTLHKKWLIAAIDGH